MGPLIQSIGEDGPRRLRIPVHSTVREACNTAGWTLPSPRSDSEITLHAYLTTIDNPFHSVVEDQYSWVTAACRGSYSSSKTWDVLRPRGPIQPWSKIIWFKGSVPKHAFNMWVSHLDRLPTRQRLADWGMNILNVCCICSSSPETRDHLLLSCNFAAQIWNQVFIRVGSPPTLLFQWSDLINWLQEPQSRETKVLRLLASQAVVYCIWKQRNNLLHNNTTTPAFTVFKEINRTIINTIHARKGRRRFHNLLQHWLI